MKTKLIFTCFLFPIFIFTLGNNQLFAQYKAPEHEIIVSYGIVSGTELVGMKFFASGIAEDCDYTKTGGTGNIFFTYRQHGQRNFTLGFAAGIQNPTYYYSNTGNRSNQSSHKINSNITTMALELKWESKKVKSDNLIIYSFIGIGYSIYSETQNPTQEMKTLSSSFFNSQWSPLCFRFGNKLGGFVEMGIGYKGLINVGLSYKIKEREIKPKSTITQGAN